MGKKQKEELPDYTVANMNLDGMPWTTKKPWQVFPEDASQSRKKDIRYAEPEQEEEKNPFLQEQEELTAKERRSLIWMTLKASLAIAAVFGFAFFLFILFCVKIWLK